MTTYEGAAVSRWNEQRPQGWRSLRIAMIGQKGLPATFGGIEHHVEEVGRRLAERGHHVTVFCRRSYSEAGGTSYRGMQLRTAPTIGTKHLDAIVHSGTSTALAMTGRFDVVHYHGLGPGLLSPLPRYAGGRAVVVQTVHGLDHQRGKWGLGARAALGSAYWLSGHVPDRTVVVSRALGDSYRDAFGRTCDYIPNGVDEPPDLPPRGIIDVLGLEPGRYLLFVGRFVPEKAPDLLLRAYRKVPGDLPLVMVGDSSFTDHYTARLKELAAGDPRVRFTGYLYGDLLSELYRYAHVFVQPSLLEGLPLTLLEAASYGRPVVASDIAPHREVIGVGGPGRRMFPSGDEGALTAALAHALDHEPAEVSGAEQLREKVRAGYRWDSAVTALERLYLEVVSSQHRLARPRHSPLSMMRRMASAGTVLLIMGLVGMVSSCSSYRADASSRVSPFSPGASATTTSRSAPPSPPVGQSSAVSDANRGLTTALFTLAERSRTVAGDKSLTAARKATAEGLASARSHLAQERREAYSAGTSCAAVISHASSARAAYGRALNGRSAALAASARLRTEVAGLDRAVAAVTKALSVLRAAVAGAHDAAGSVSTTDVESALGSATTLRATVLADITTTDRKTADAVAGASKATASAASVAGKVC